MLVLIPARGGSKGIPGKNIKELGGKPLIQYTIDAAIKVFDKEDILISTDDKKIKEVVEKTGIEVPFLRPAHLATDSAGTHEVLIHALDYSKSLGKNYQKIMVLQPTSPFRTSAHIQEAMKLYNDDLDMVVSVKETKSNPYYVLKEENEQGFLINSKVGNFTRRQDCPKVWELNGAIYIINVESLRRAPISEFSKVKKFVMDDRSSIDLDDEIDWNLAESYIKMQ